MGVCYGIYQIKLWVENIIQQESIIIEDIYYLSTENHVHSVYEEVATNQWKMNLDKSYTSQSNYASLQNIGVGNNDDIHSAPPTWWECTVGCFNTAKSACAGDPECDLMCDVVNVFGGLCTLGMLIACGISCA